MHPLCTLYINIEVFCMFIYQAADLYWLVICLKCVNHITASILSIYHILISSYFSVYWSVKCNESLPCTNWFQWNMRDEVSRNLIMERSIRHSLCKVNKEHLPFSRPAVYATNYLAGHLSGSNPVTDIKIALSSQSGLLCGKKLAICGLGVCTFVMPERWP